MICQPTREYHIQGYTLATASTHIHPHICMKIMASHSIYVHMYVNLLYFRFLPCAGAHTEFIISLWSWQELNCFQCIQYCCHFVIVMLHCCCCCWVTLAGYCLILLIYNLFAVVASGYGICGGCGCCSTTGPPCLPLLFFGPV